LPQRFTASDRLQAIDSTFSQALLQRLQTDSEACTALLGKDLGKAIQDDLTDGLRLTFEHGDIVHLRPSGNAPELRCYAEADSMARADALVTRVLTAISQTM
jgi:phosphomannomutase